MEIYSGPISIKVKKLVVYGALLYTFITIVNSLFLPSGHEIPGDNFLFVFGFIHLILVFIEEKSFRWLIAAFWLFFICLLLTTYFNSKLNYDAVLIVSQVLKWPVIIGAVLYHGIEKLDRFIDPLTDVIFMLLVGINLFMLLDLGGTGEALQNYFAPKFYTNFVAYNEPGTFRLSGTFSNPNDNGLVFGLFTIYYLYRRGKSFWYYSLLGILLILLTQSRTCFIGMGIPFVILIFSNLKSWSRRKILIGFPAILLLIFCAMYFSSNLRSILIGTAFTSNSFATRYRNLVMFTDENFNHWYGMGIIQDELSLFGHYIDSEMVAVLLQAGFIGLFLWIFIWLSMVFLRGKNFSRTLLACVGFLIVCSFTNYTLLNGSVLGVLAFVFALAARKENTITPINSPSIA